PRLHTTVLTAAWSRDDGALVRGAVLRAPARADLVAFCRTPGRSANDAFQFVWVPAVPTRSLFPVLVAAPCRRARAEHAAHRRELPVLRDVGLPLPGASLRQLADRFPGRPEAVVVGGAAAAPGSDRHQPGDAARPALLLQV